MPQIVRAGLGLFFNALFASILFLVVADRPYSRFYAALKLDNDRVGLDKLDAIGHMLPLLGVIAVAAFLFWGLAWYVEFAAVAVAEEADTVRGKLFLFVLVALLFPVLFYFTVGTWLFHVSVIHSARAHIKVGLSLFLKVACLTIVIGGWSTRLYRNGKANLAAIVGSIAFLAMSYNAFVGWLPHEAARIGRCAAAGYPTTDLTPRMPGGPVAPHFSADAVRLEGAPSDPTSLQPPYWLYLATTGGRLIVYNPVSREPTSVPADQTTMIDLD